MSSLEHVLLDVQVDGCTLIAAYGIIGFYVLRLGVLFFTLETMGWIAANIYAVSVRNKTKNTEPIRSLVCVLPRRASAGVLGLLIRRLIRRVTDSRLD